MTKIISRSVISDGGVSISSEFYSAETRLNEHGNIITLQGNPRFPCVQCFPCIFKDMKWRFFVGFIFYLALVLIPKPLNFQYATLFCARVVLSLFLLIPILLKLSCKKGINARYHTALHQVENAYNSLRRVPTLEESKQSSVVSENCLLHKLFQTIIGRIPLVIAALVSDDSFKSVLALCLFAAIWLFILYPILQKKKYTNFLELLFLPKPTDKELQVAIECLSHVVDKPSLEDFEDTHFKKNTIYIS